MRNIVEAFGRIQENVTHFPGISLRRINTKPLGVSGKLQLRPSPAYIQQ